MGLYDIEHKRLCEEITYDPETGLFFRIKKSRGHDAGPITYVSKSSGYLIVGVFARQFQGHRLAWFHHYGEWPKHHVDHINGIKTDNRICNLRDVTQLVNNQNVRSANRRSKTGYVGVVPNKKRFSAQICRGDAQYHLGTFDTPELAHAAYVEAKRRLHEGCTI